MKILIADDSKTTRLLLTESLKKLGHEVTIAGSGREAVDLFLKERPDLIILDVLMEDMDGFETARSIRVANSEDWIPIIFLSSAVDDENIAKGIEAGGDDYLAKPFSEITLAAKIKAMQRISDMRQALYALTQKLSTLSSTDGLTGIYNRLQFDRTLQVAIAHANRHNEMFALLFLDLDKFKSVNDHLGHHIGDLLLKGVAKRLKTCLRIDDFIARLGGDEFAIIMTDIKDTKVIGDVAQKIQTALAPPYSLGGKNVNISTSIGIACYNPSASVDEETLVRNADMAMYHAKECGRNTYQYFTEELNRKYVHQVNLESALRMALDKHQLFLMYQPIFHLETKRMIKMEALVYWKHPELGLILPDTFMPIAESIGLMDAFGLWILESICKQASAWVESGHTHFMLSTNVSARQLLHKNIVEIIQQTLEKMNVSAELLEFELSEASAYIYTEMFKAILVDIQKLGISIALDDFGMSYSSLNHLKSLPVNTIKIDKAFIKDIMLDINSAVVVKSMIALGKSLGFEVIAEGIEKEEQLKILVKNKCYLGQGSYLSPPLSAEEMTALLNAEEDNHNDKRK